MMRTQRGMRLPLLLLAAVVCASALLATRSSTALAASVIDGSSSFSPFATDAPPFSPVPHPLPPSNHWTPSLRQRVQALPTNKWWQNLVLEPSNQPVTVSPLAVRIEAVDTNQLLPYNRTAEYEFCRTDRTGTHCPEWDTHAASTIRTLRKAGGRRGANFALPPKMANVEMVATFFQPGFGFSAVEPLGAHVISNFDSLSVTVDFPAQGREEDFLLQEKDNAPRMTLPLVRGMPYATAVYTGLTPFLYTHNAILRCNAQDLPGKVSGNKLRLVLNSEQTVLIYAWQRSLGGAAHKMGQRHAGMNDLLQWEWDRNTVKLVGPGGGRGNWVVRLAFLPSAKSSFESRHEIQSMEDALDQYASTYPTGGEWEYEFASANDASDEENVNEDMAASGNEMLRTKLSFTTDSQPTNQQMLGRKGREGPGGRGGKGPAPLLLMALAHQQRTLVDATFVKSVIMDTLVGNMVGVSGSSWTLSTPAVDISFRAPRPVVPSRVEALKDQLLRDLKSSANAGEPDPYGFGKSIAKIGRLVLIGDEMGMGDSFKQELLGKMKSFLSPWLAGENRDALMYDETYGGIVSSDGLKDPGADFGQGYYNDHHFHYGYIVYGCAVVAQYDRAWASTWLPSILALVRDYANPALENGSGSQGGPSDDFFPRLRHFDIFDSHSWASGLFVFADGRNQESSSESINGYYSLALLGKALGNKAMESVGRALTTMEVLGTRTYWHSTTASSVYPEVYASNKCVGMVWSDKVVDATWFAAGKVYIHGINMLPFTPMSEMYLTSDWVEEEFPVVKASITGEITDEWKGFLWATHSVIAPAEAWEEIESLTSFDGGNTRSNAMYFAATRPKAHEEEREIMDQRVKDVLEEGKKHMRSVQWPLIAEQ